MVIKIAQMVTLSIIHCVPDGDTIGGGIDGILVDSTACIMCTIIYD